MAHQHLVLEGSLHTPILLFYVKIDAGSEECESNLTQ